MRTSFTKLALLVSWIAFSVAHDEDSGHADEPAESVKNIGFIVFPGYEVLDFWGPMSPLNMVSNQVPGLSLSIISKTLDPISSAPLTASEHGSDFAQSMLATHTLDAPPANLDVLIVPGGPGARANETELQPYFNFIKEQYPNLKYLISVCTGATFLARAGVLDGRNATTNKFSWEFGTGTGPNVNWVPEARWTVDGNIWTTSGVAAGLDGIFAFISHVWGEERSLKVANILEYERHLDPSYDPYAEIWNVTGIPTTVMLDAPVETGHSHSRRDMSESGREPPFKSIGYIIFPGIEVLDVMGPVSALNMLSHTVPGVKFSMLSKTLDPVSSGPITLPNDTAITPFKQQLIPTHTLDAPPEDMDVLFVPGGPGARANETELQPYYDFIREQYPNLKYLVSVCTGATFLAKAGVLDGRKATTNKFSWKFGTGTGPNVDWVPQARWVVDGNIWSTSGVTAGIDGTFAFINELFGEEKSKRISDILEYERTTDSTHDIFAEIWNVTAPVVTEPTATTSVPLPSSTSCKAARRRSVPRRL